MEQSNRFGAPAPKPSAIPNFAKPGYEVKNFSDVVKGYFRPERGRSQEEKVLAPQRVFGLAGFCCRFGAPAPRSECLPTGMHWILLLLARNVLYTKRKEKAIKSFCRMREKWVEKCQRDVYDRGTR